MFSLNEQNIVLLLYSSLCTFAIEYLRYMKTIYYLLSIFFSLNTFAQSTQCIDTIKPSMEYENMYMRPLFSDSLSSSFVIYVKKEVKPHKHVSHTEQVYVLDGIGEMLIGEKKFNVKKGDIIFIPKNTVHALINTSSVPIKVISIQSPYFDGSDRIAVDIH